MYSHVVTKDPTEVEVEVQAAYLAMFPDGDKLFVPQIFGWVIDCFSGRYPGYQAIDAQYHDFEHTLQGALCMGRILYARHRANVEPRTTREMFELGIMAILLHDTGYLKRTGDVSGTGAKYTVIHVRRSADFAAELLRGKGYHKGQIHAVQDMILCTGLNAALDKIPFQTELERMVGFALGTADLLGQMAADDYVEKLPVLYAEFAEASRHEGGKNSVGEYVLQRRRPDAQDPGFLGKLCPGKTRQGFQRPLPLHERPISVRIKLLHGQNRGQHRPPAPPTGR